MKKTVFIVFLFISYSILGQNKTVDSLLILLKTDIQDTNRVINLNKLHETYNLISEYDKGWAYGKEALALAQSLGYKKGIAKAFSNIGFYYANQDNPPEALNNQLQALKLFEEIGDKEDMAWTHTHIGNIYLSQDNYSESQKNILEAMKISKEIGFKKGIAIGYGGLAILHSENGKKADDQGDTTKSNYEYNEALKAYLTGLKIYNEIGDKVNAAGSYYYIGKMYVYRRNYSTALVNYLYALKLFEELAEREAIAAVNIEIGNVFTKQGKYSDALQFFNKVQTTKMKKFFSSEKALGLSEVYEKMGQQAKALEYYKLYHAIKDSMSGSDMITKIAKLQNQYQNQKEEKIRQLETQKKEDEHQAEVKQQRIIIWSVAGGSLLIILFSIFVFRSLKTTRRQKIIIEEKQKEVMDSIRYASRIQRALITSEKYIATQLNRLMKNN